MVMFAQIPSKFFSIECVCTFGYVCVIGEILVSVKQTIYTYENKCHS